MPSEDTQPKAEHKPVILMKRSINTKKLEILWQVLKSVPTRANRIKEMKINYLSFKSCRHTPDFVGARWLVLARWHVGTANSFAEAVFFAHFSISHHQ